MRGSRQRRSLQGWPAGIWALLAGIALVAVAGCSSDAGPSPTPTRGDVGTPTQVAIPTPNPRGTSTTAPSFTPAGTPAGTPTLGSTRTAGPAPTTSLPPTPPLDGPLLLEPPDRDPFQLVRSLKLKSDVPIPAMVNPEPVRYVEGRVDSFWILDSSGVRVYTTQATLELVSPGAYWYVEDGLDVSRGDLIEVARAFEGEIYPRVTAAFGSERTPGVDNDVRMTILNARLSGSTLGYFSSVDEYPLIVHPHSNEREMLYLNAGVARVGSSRYLAVLSHELQHLINWNGDPSEELWITEGLSEVATGVAGHRPRDYDGVRQQAVFLQSPTVPLVHWPLRGSASANYGAAYLFFDYLSSHYGTRRDLALLVQEPLDGIAGIDAYLGRLGFDADFSRVFGDWTVANYLDEPGGGPYGYPDIEVGVRPDSRIRDFGSEEYAIAQYSAGYTALDITSGDVRLYFQGQEQTPLLPVPVEGGGCWWSNRGDSISSTLTRGLDLSEVAQATLRYGVWYEVEEGWDYAYVQVSTDGGSTWDILEAPRSSPLNPLGNSFGPGYTGDSGGWIQEEVDLTPYAGGRDILLRFHYVTDQGVTGIGMCVDNIEVPELGFFDSADHGGSSGWEARGFVATDNQVPQDYIVHVIEVGDETRVTRMELDDSNGGELVIRGLEDLDELVIVVAALAEATQQEATYRLRVEPVDR